MNADIERWMAAVLSGSESTASPRGRTTSDRPAGLTLPAPLDVIAQAAAHHGVTTLLHRATGELAHEARCATALDIAREAELERVLDAFDRDAVRMVVTKGAALARTLYGASSLRARSDSDLLVADRTAAARTLESLGYRNVPHAVGDLVIRQQLWRRSDRVRHDVDLHWSLSNRARFAGALPFEELFARGVVLREHVRAISHADALLHAAIHLAGHHDGEERLIWYFDVHLLMEKLGDAAVAEAIERAGERGCGREMRGVIEQAAAWFGDSGRWTVAGRRYATPATVHRPPSTALATLADDLRATHGVTNRARLLRQHLIPRADHVMRKYGMRHRALLPLYYARRIVAAALREVIRAKMRGGFHKPVQRFSMQGQTHREVGAQSMKSPS